MQFYTCNQIQKLFHYLETLKASLRISVVIHSHVNNRHAEMVQIWNKDIQIKIRLETVDHLESVTFIKTHTTVQIGGLMLTKSESNDRGKKIHFIQL